MSTPTNDPSSRRIGQEIAIGAEGGRRSVVEEQELVVVRADVIDAGVGHADRRVGRLRHADVDHADEVAVAAADRGEAQEGRGAAALRSRA